MNMTKEQSTTVLELASEHGIDAEDYGKYSGRGMFGDTTFAITVPDDETIGELKALYREKTGKFLSVSKDGMGKSLVIY